MIGCFVPIELGVGDGDTTVDTLDALTFKGGVFFFVARVFVLDIDFENKVGVLDVDANSLAMGVFNHVGEHFLINHQVIVGDGGGNLVVELAFIGCKVNIIYNGNNSIVGKIFHPFNEIEEVVIFRVKCPDEVANSLDSIFAKRIELMEEIFLLFGAILSSSNLGGHCFEDI